MNDVMDTIDAFTIKPKPDRFTTPQLDKLAAALAKAQGMIEPAPKDADNPYYKSKYATLPAVRAAMKDAFAVNGLSVVQIPTTDTGPDKIGVIKLHTVLLHASGQVLDCGELQAEVDIVNPQKMGSAITYFRRYALAAISQTVADDDDDGNAASVQKAAEPRTAKDKRDMATALKEIADAVSLEDLKAIGVVIKDKYSPAVHNAVGPAWLKRQKQIKAMEEADG